MKNTTVIAVAVALLIGGIAGSTYAGYGGKEKMKSIRDEQNTVRMSESYNMPDAADFVSVRPGVSALPSEDLSTDEIDGLLFMREEEKLARDVYTALYEKWSLPIFSNIAQSEQTHTEAVKNVLDKYNLDDPVTDDSIGVFVNETLQNLYNDLTVQGMSSIEDALIVGATIEDLDISDLLVQLEKTDNQDITLVYENLLRGSRNHLRAFISQLQRYDGNYVPQYITQDVYDEILSSQQETGMMRGSGTSGWGWSNRR